jgi:hypothetical protein
MPILILIFGVPFGIVALVAWLMGRRARRQQEQKYAPFYQRIETFAQAHGFSALRVPLFDTYASDAIRRLLPKDLPKYGQSKLVVPLYNDREDYYGKYRSAYVLTKGEVRILWLPKHLRNAEEFFSVLLYLAPMPATEHWFTLWKEEYFDFGKDHALESRHFNNIYAVNCSSPALATEILPPEFMEFLLQQRRIRTYIRLRGSIAIVGQEAAFSEERLRTVMRIAEEVLQRFTRAYVSHPVPKRSRTR